MIGPAEARRTARDRLASRLTAWATTTPEPPALSIPLKPPTEREALADQATAEAWARSWASLDLPSGAVVDRETRIWRRIGRQEVPVRLRLAGPDTVAAFVGGAPARDWHGLVARVAEIRRTLSADDAVDAAVRRHGAKILTLPPERLTEVLGVVDWLAGHPALGMRPRQVPIRGVDTKWLAAHRSLVTDLHAAVTGEPDLGLVEADRLVRVRILDPTLAPDGPQDFAAPVDQLARLAVAPSVVMVFENLESLLALPAWSGAVALHGSGYAVDVVASLPWTRCSQVLYWGDLDSHGFAILHRLRRHLPDAVSVLMDEATLLDHRDLWVTEPQPTTGRFDTLTTAERVTLERLRAEGNVRLEQERIPWTRALTALRTVATPQAGGRGREPD